MQSGFYFLFVLKILLHLVNSVEKMGTGGATFSWGRKKCQLLPLGGWEEAAELQPDVLPFCWRPKEHLQCFGRAGGCLCFTSAPNSLNSPESSQTLTLGLVGTSSVSLGMTQGLGLRFCCKDACVITSVGFLSSLLAFALLSSAMAMNKKKKKTTTKQTNGKPWETSSSRKSRWVDGWGRFSLLLTESCFTPLYCKSLP